MAEQEYIRSLSAFTTSSGVCAPDRFTEEIDGSSITIKLLDVQVEPEDHDGEVVVTFAAPISAGEEATFDGLIANHDGTPLPDDSVQTVQLQQIQANGVPEVVLAPSIGSDIRISTHNFSDASSWYEESVRIVGETLSEVEDGQGSIFTSIHKCWIDPYSGRIPADEDVVAAQKQRNPTDPHGYGIKVLIDGVEATRDRPFHKGEADYHVHYCDGHVHLNNPHLGSVVVVDYSYATGSRWILRPPSDKVYIVKYAEADFSQDVHMRDDFIYGVFVRLPDGTLISMGEDKYKRSIDLALEAVGNYPVLQPIGASGGERELPLNEFRRVSRGIRGPIQAMPFEYDTVRYLDGSQGVELHVWLQDDTVFGGENTFVTFRCLVEDAT